MTRNRYAAPFLMSNVVRPLALASYLRVGLPANICLLAATSGSNLTAAPGATCFLSIRADLICGASGCALTEGREHSACGILWPGQNGCHATIPCLRDGHLRDEHGWCEGGDARYGRSRAPQHRSAALVDGAWAVRRRDSLVPRPACWIPPLSREMLLRALIASRAERGSVR